MGALLTVDRLNVEIATASGPLKAVRDLSFSVQRGEIFCLVGESGCGKSMTALSLMGLLPKKATIRAETLAYNGQSLLSGGGEALIGDRIAMIFQEPMTAFNPVFSIGNQMIEGYRRHKKTGVKEARERAAYLLGKVGIANPERRLEQFPHQLSGGLRQRAMIAMALMCGPDLLIADEPTTALDVTIQAQILRLLLDLRAEFNLSIVLITHDLGLVARIADRVGVMYAGEMVEAAPARALFAQPRHPYTRGLIDCIPVPGKTLPGARLGSIAGVVPSLIGGISGCAFRSRCPLAKPACAETVPEHNHDGHFWRCIHGEES